MRHIWVRPLRLHDEADKAAFIAAADASGKEFPNQVFTLPSTRIMVAEEEGKIIMYQPQFLSLQLGSLIHGQQSQNKLASAQHQLVAAAFTRAHTEGLADILALSDNEYTKGFATRHGFKAADCMRLEVR